MPDAKRSTTRLFLFLFSTIALVSWGRPVSSQAGPPNPSDDEINAVARKLYCPVCENIPLDVCATQACAQWRDVIREKLSQGWTQEQIISYFAEQYGDRVLAAPPVRDAMSPNILAYVIPPLAFLAGTVIVIHYFTRKKTGPSLNHVAEPASRARENEDAYIKRIEEEIRHNP